MSPGKTMPGKRHEGYAEFKFELDGDTAYLSVPRAKLERFLEIAKSRGVRASDLLRAAVERYDLLTAIDKVIAEDK